MAYKIWKLVQIWILSIKDVVTFLSVWPIDWARGQTWEKVNKQFNKQLNKLKTIFAI